MSNYIEYDDAVAFHPGFYIEELIEREHTTIPEYAKLLNMPSKDLDKIVNGEQDIIIDIAKKLSEATGTSIEYWMNLQNRYDSIVRNRKK